MCPKSRNPVGNSFRFLFTFLGKHIMPVWPSRDQKQNMTLQPSSHVPSSHCPQNQNIQNINLLVQRSLWVPNTMNFKKTYINKSSWNFRKPLKSSIEKNQVTLIGMRIGVVLHSHWQLWGNEFELRFLYPTKL